MDRPRLFDMMKARLPFLRLSEGRINQAVELARSAEDRLSLIYLNYRVGNFQGALAESQMALQDALEKGSLRSQAWALQMRGMVELAMGLMDTARRTAEELEKCVTGTPIQKLVRHNYFLMGMIEREVGRYSDAVDYLKKAIALLPGESWGLGYSWHSLFLDGLAAAYSNLGIWPGRRRSAGGSSRSPYPGSDTATSMLEASIGSGGSRKRKGKRLKPSRTTAKSSTS